MNFYISKFRYKLAFACAAGVIIMIINGLFMNMGLVQVFREFGMVFLVLLLMSVLLWYPAFKYAASDPKKLWTRWGISGRQKSRQEFEDIHFDRVYQKTRYGLAKEPGKGYRTMTTLESCNCTEFRKTHKPCKHMYKLADELGIYEG